MSTNQKIAELQQTISEEQSLIEEYEKLIKQKKKRINACQLELWDCCTHTWVRDYNACFDDCCKHYCSLCFLWRDRSMYT